MSDGIPGDGVTTEKTPRGSGSDLETVVMRQKSAIQHGIYMAYAAERFLAAVNNLDRVMDDENTEQDDIDDAEQARSEWWAALQDAVHEFKKRA